MKRILSPIWLLVLVVLPQLVFAAERRISGVVRLSGDTNITDEVITFEDGATIVTNGHRLTIDGTKEIRFEGSPRIISYEQREMAPGDSGRRGGAIYIKTPRMSGTTLKIMNDGEPAAKGRPGSQGPKGAKGPQGTQRDHNLVNGCIGGSDGGRGGGGGDGSDGGAGGNGGAGGIVILDVRKGCMNGAIPRLDISVTGGSEGDGGDAGAPGPGGDGGDGAPGTFWCGGTSPGPPGPAGRPGRQGLRGAPGNSGTVIDLNEACHDMTKVKPEEGAIGHS